MTVKELREELYRFPENMEVLCTDFESVCYGISGAKYGYVSEDGDEVDEEIGDQVVLLMV